VATSRIAEHVGRVLSDRYRLTRPLGTGASAHVYVAEDVSLRRRVAVKLLHPALADDESFLRRFQAEARVVAALRHPNVLRVYDWGNDEETPFLVMELLEGGSLRSLLDRGGRLSPGQAAAIGAEAAHALDYAHRRGLIHRDIKPANLLFDDEGHLSVADFGLARALAEATWTEPAGAVLGTARYAAPEQVQGRVLDGRADVYALALVLVEAVTGRVPFAADTTIGTLMARIDQPLVGPPELGPLGPIIERAGTPDAADRIDAAGLALAFEEVIRQLPRPAPLALAGPLVTGDVEADDQLTELPGRPKLFDGEALERSGSAPLKTGAGQRGRDTAHDATGPVPVLGPDGGAPVAGAGRKRRHWRRWALAILAAAALVAGGAVALVRAAVPSHPVPSLAKATEAQAVAALTPLHLHLRVANRPFSETAPVGTIVRQRPESGRLREGSTVSVDVSAGPPPVPVPDLAGLSQADATQRLAGAGLVPGQVSSRVDAGVHAGAVIDWTGRGGPLPKGSPVNLVISSGPPTVVVPDVHGQSFAAAQAALAALQLTAVESDQFSDTVPKGQVVSTSPAISTAAVVGSQVAVVVSKGQDLVAVTDVTGQTVAAATKNLQAAGFSVSEVVGSPDRLVYVTNPPKGAMVKRGSAIKLYTS
jgi:beta-lactam-binding protein with PASTA domain/tRNA A-37 threonylcarbamoyl transferase component Bud32